MKAISLFSGAGGMDIGVIQAGFDILACVEIDPHCCATLRDAILREKRSTRVIQADIRDLDPTQIMQQFNQSSGTLDLLFGGPPCQSFSQIGKQQGLNDERGLLLFEMVRFARAMLPKAILIEEVKGLQNIKDSRGKSGGVLKKLISDLEALSYTVAWKVILAADYGVAQLRERIFIVGVRESSTPFTFPEPTHAPNKSNLFGLLPYTTVRQALAGLPAPQPKRSQIPENSHMDVTPDGDKRRIHGVPEGNWLSSQTHLPSAQLGNLTKKDTTKFRRLSFESPAITLRGGEIFFHPTEDRILTPREYMRLHGYPDNYILRGPIRSRSGRVKTLDQHRQIANSVPPPVAYVLARAIAQFLVEAMSCPKYSKFSAFA
jgi:DNA (cytosine-5)-methyltransferase 1